MLSLHFSVYAVFAALLAIVLSVWLAWLSIRNERGGALGVAWQCLRFTMVAAVSFLLFRPELVRKSKIMEKPILRVLVDGSASMNTRDVYLRDGNIASRKEWVRAAMTSEMWSVVSKFRVIESEFSGVSTNDNVSNACTDLSSPLVEIARDATDTRCIVLFSDGDWNAGDHPVSAASRLLSRGIPVCSVSVGSEKFLPDIELSGVSAPLFVFSNDKFAIPFTIRSRLGREVITRVQVSGSGVESAGRDVRVPPMSSVSDSLAVIPVKQGKTVLTVSMPVEDEEIDRYNNSVTVTVDVRSETFKTLVVENTPRWEYRFLRNALLRDPGVDVDVVLFHSGRETGEGLRYLPSFPSSEKELFAYDVIILGDVGIASGMLTMKDTEAVSAVVRHQGTGLVFLPGPAGNQRTFIGTPLGDLMPVLLDIRTPEGIFQPSESRMELTETGKDHILTSLSNDPLVSATIWRSLPGFFWYAGVERAKPGSYVLAVHSTARNAWGRIPLIAVRPAGNGRALFLGVDGIWRWRRGFEDTYHYRLWGQIARWMAYRRHVASGKGMRLFFSPERPAAGEKVFLNALLLEGMEQSSNGKPLDAVMKGPDGTSTRLTLEESKEKGWGLFTGSFVPVSGGVYSIKVECPWTGGAAETAIEVLAPVREKTGVPARKDVLTEISDVTGGACFGFEEFDKVVGFLEKMSDPPFLEKRLRLWCHPLTLAILIIGLGLFWVGRKFMGLV